MPQESAWLTAVISGVFVYFFLMAFRKVCLSKSRLRLRLLKGNFRNGRARTRNETVWPGFTRAVGWGLTAGTLGGWILGGTPMIAAGALIGGVAGYRVSDGRRLELAQKRRQELESVLSAVSMCVKSGLSIPQALERAVAETGPALRSELEGCLREYQVGLALPEALKRAGRRTGCPGLNDLAALVELHAKYGGNLSQSLAGLTEGLRRERLAQEEMTVKTTESRNAALVLALLPFLMFLYLVRYQPEMVQPLWQEKVGQAALAGAVLLWTAGTWLAAKFLSSEELNL